MSIVHEALRKAERESAGSFPSRIPPRDPIRRSFLEFGPKALCFVLFLGLAGAVLFFYLPKMSSAPPVRSAGVIAKALPSRSPEPAAQRAPLRLQEGLSYFRQGQLPQAEEAFRDAVRIAPTLAVAHNNLGLVLRREGRLPEAASEYEEALRIDPRYPEALHNLGLVKDRQGLSGEAISRYREALALDSSLVEAHYQLGGVLERTGDLNGAREEFRLFLSQAKGWDEGELDRVHRHLQDLERR